MQTIIFKADEEQKKRWQVLAHGELVSLSEWIRLACEARANGDTAAVAPTPDSEIWSIPPESTTRAEVPADPQRKEQTGRRAAAGLARAKGKCDHPFHGRVGWRCPGCREMF